MPLSLISFSLRHLAATFVLIFIGLSLPAQATTSEELVDLCKGVKSNSSKAVETFHSGACFGYVRSLLETTHMILMAVDQVSDKADDSTSSIVKSGVQAMRSAYCIPDDGTLWDYVYYFLDYMEVHPSEMDDMVIYSFRKSMSTNYPCQT